MRRPPLLLNRFGPALLLLGLLLTASGCGRKGSISGKVSLNGKPLTSGFVSFVPSDPSKGQRATIEDDGTYRVENVPTGTVKIVILPKGGSGPGRGGPPRGMGAQTRPVKTEGFNPEGSPPQGSKPEGGSSSGGPPKASSQDVSIPEEFQDPAKTPLSYEVKAGPQQKDIEMTGTATVPPPRGPRQ